MIVRTRGFASGDSDGGLGAACDDISGTFCSRCCGPDKTPKRPECPGAHTPTPHALLRVLVRAIKGLAWNGSIMMMGSHCGEPSAARGVGGLTMVVAPPPFL